MCRKLISKFQESVKTFIQENFKQCSRTAKPGTFLFSNSDLTGIIIYPRNCKQKLSKQLSKQF